jgi:hypothetical protein
VLEQDITIEEAIQRQLDRIEAKLDALFALLERYQPLLDAAEKRITGKSPRMFGGRNAGG